MSDLLKNNDAPRPPRRRFPGPTLALEVARAYRGHRCAHPQLETAKRVQALLDDRPSALYTSQDWRASNWRPIKNVVALAAGIGDGLGLGTTPRRA